jgi:hypothetical protein
VFSGLVAVEGTLEGRLLGRLEGPSGSLWRSAHLLEGRHPRPWCGPDDLAVFDQEPFE